MPIRAILARFVVTVESDTYSKVPHEASGIDVNIVAGGHNYEGLSAETAREIQSAMRQAALAVLRELASIQRDEGPESGEAVLLDVVPSAAEIHAARRADIEYIRKLRMGEA